MCHGEFTLGYNQLNMCVIFLSMKILVYPIGIPILYFYLLWSRKEEIMSRPDAIKTASCDGTLPVKPASSKTRLVNFLYESYRPQHWYFEIVETSRRLTLTAILSVIAAGTSLQIIVAMLFAQAYLEVYAGEILDGKAILFIHERGVYITDVRPYNSIQNNILSKVALYQIFFTYLIALIIKKVQYHISTMILI